MPRLKFDLTPEGPWRGETVEEHNAALVEQVATWTWWDHGELQPCSCGLYVEGMVCTCRPQERKNHTPEWVAKTLESRARRQHLDGLKKKREFPALPRCPMGTCYWCRKPIVHGRRKQRSMHDGREDEPNCRYQYDLRLTLDTQRSYLLDRDGNGCASCGVWKGRHGAIWTDATDDRVESTWSTRAWIRERFGVMPAGPLTYIGWSTALEVDHRIALAVAWLAFPDPERRRWFFSPANLRLLCHDCHALKTQEDRLLLRQAAVFGDEWLKAQVLRLLAEAGQLVAARTGNPP